MKLSPHRSEREELTGVFSPPPDLALAGPHPVDAEEAVARRLRWEQQRSVNGAARVVLWVALAAHLGITFGDQAAFGGRLQGWEPFSFFGLLAALVAGVHRLRRPVPVREVVVWAVILGLGFELRIVALSGLCAQGPELYLGISTMLCGFCVAWIDAPGPWPGRTVAVIYLIGAVAGLLDPRIPIHLVPYLLVAAGFNLGIMGHLRERRRRIEGLTRQLGQQAYVDALTGLGGRRWFDEVATRKLAELGDGEPVAVLFVDLDHFKALNDRFGHARGDEALITTAAAIRAEVEGHVAARYGGEEFAVLACGLDVEATMALANGLRLRIGRSAWPSTTASVGVAWGRAGEEALEDLLRRADSALYLAKGAGRDRATLAPPPVLGMERMRPIGITG